jgi:outer membrane protein TolC
MKRTFGCVIVVVIGSLPVRVAAQVPANGVFCGITSTRSAQLRDVVVETLQQQPDLIVAQQEIEKSRANLTAALTPFFPNAVLAFENERFVPHGPQAPVTVVGNNVIGGNQTYSGYGSINLNWNLFNGGKDIAGYRGAKAGVRSSEAALQAQLDDTLLKVVSAHGDLSKAQIAAKLQNQVLQLTKSIQDRATERFNNGTGTNVAVAQARIKTLSAERDVNQACRAVADKSAALAQTIGIRLPVGQILLVDETVRPDTVEETSNNFDSILEQDPAVIAAKENVTAAEDKLKQARAAYHPSVSLFARRDYLGQDPQALSAANHSIGPSGYRYGLMIQQPILPLTSETANIRSAAADHKKAQATYEQTLIAAETNLRNALSREVETKASASAAQTSLFAARQILTLTESLYRAGRTDLDSLEHAQIDVTTGEEQAKLAELDTVVAEWNLRRALRAGLFVTDVLRQIGIDSKTVNFK